MRRIARTKTGEEGPSGTDMEWTVLPCTGKNNSNNNNSKTQLPWSRSQRGSCILSTMQRRWDSANFVTWKTSFNYPKLSPSLQMRIKMSSPRGRWERKKSKEWWQRGLQVTECCTIFGILSPSYRGASHGIGQPWRSIRHSRKADNG